VGNRARGERLSHLVSPDRARIAAALLLCSPFVPLLFQGEEWAASTPFLYFTSHDDSELGRLVCEGRRREFAAFGWDPAVVPDPQAVETFERSRLRRDERDRAAHASMLEWYRALIALRRDQPALRDGARERTLVDVDEGSQRLTLIRGDIFVACNLGSGVAVASCPAARRLLLASTPEITLVGGQIHLPPDSVAIMGSGVI
jgi:maltooligosyltrehalose trehalohydrolase